MSVGCSPKVARDREHRLGGPDRVVKAALGDLGPKPRLKGPGQRPHLLDLGKQQFDPIGLQLEQNLPVRIVKPGCPVGLIERISAVFLQVLRDGSSLSGIVSSFSRYRNASSSKKNFFCSIMHFM